MDKDEVEMLVIFQCFEYFEIILNILSQIVTIYYFLIFIKTSFVHTNMLRLIKLLFLYYILSQSMRLIMAVKEVIVDGIRVFGNDTLNYIIFNDTNPFIVVDLIRVGCLVAALGSMTSIIRERIFATIHLKNYEKLKSNSFLIISFIISQLAPGIGCTYAMYIEILDLRFAGVVVTSVSIIMYIIFNFLEWYNKKQYKVSLIKTKKYTLSERFQLQENIRTALLVKKFAVVLFILNFVVGATLIISNYLQKEKSKMFAYFAFNYYLSFYGFIFALVWYCSNRSYFARYLNSKGLVHPARSDVEKQKNQRDGLRAFNGVKLIFTADEEREIAFKQLSEAWN